VRIRALAPASTANLGPGFDTAAAALDLWNEVVVEDADDGPVVEIEGEGADELPRDESHLSLRAFALLASVERRMFTFYNRIPLERGLGSSAAAIVIGLLAGSAAAGGGHSRDELLALGEQLEGHSDNLAAALYGGVSVTWVRDGARHARQLASGLPLVPLLAVPTERASTARSRDGLPATVSHGDAAANAAHAALLGAAISSGDAKLLAASFSDRLHEQYRLDDAPLLRLLREAPPADSAGVTLSGSGPTVVVWSEPDDVDAVERELEQTLPEGSEVIVLDIVPEGAWVE
jgi:homoserine kinase